MKMRPLLLAAGVAVAAWLAFFGDKTPASDIAEPVVRAPGAATASTSSTTAATAATAAKADGSVAHTEAVSGEPVILALETRENLIGGEFAPPRTESFFASQSWTPPAPPPPAPTKPLPPPPPVAPPLPFTFLGKKNEAGRWEVFLARGDQTLIVHEQSVIEGIYQIDAIEPPTLTVTYLPLKQKQILTIGGAD